MCAPRRVGRSRRADERGRSENELAASTAPSGVWLEGRRGARALPGIGLVSVSAKARAPRRRLFTSFRPRRVEKAEPFDRGRTKNQGRHRCWRLLPVPVAGSGCMRHPAGTVRVSTSTLAGVLCLRLLKCPLHHFVVPLPRKQGKRERERDIVSPHACVGSKRRSLLTAGHSKECRDVP
ncbi:hypothetical protein FHS64_000260 [Brevundimonas terrae]|nr:hypothetical protein [Brevundimonas terrae]